MHVRSPLVAHLKAAETVEPRERAFHHPAIPPKSLARFDSAAGDAWDDATLAAGRATARVIVALVGVQFAWTSTGTPTTPMRPAKGWDRVDGLLEHPRVMHIRS